MSRAGKTIKHKRRGARKFDLTAIREVMKDQRVWCCLGVVLASEDAGPHFDLDAEGVTVEVEFQPSGDQVTAVVGTIGGSFGAGIWAIPPVGSEVLVLVPDGELDFQPTIVGLTSSGALPDDVAIDKIIIAAPAGGEVYVHDGVTGVEPLVKKSEFDAHKHSGALGGTGSAPAQTSVPSSDPVGTPAPITGTTILKAK